MEAVLNPAANQLPQATRRPLAVPYLQHFGLQEAPFGITPDTAFVFAAHAHQEALNTLLVALNSGEGFVKIVGEVGTGKTLLCRRLLRNLQGADDCLTAYLPNPGISPEELLRTLASELNLPPPENGLPASLIRRLNEGLLAFAQQGKRVVVCLDEAQAIPQESLETLRLLSNLETEKSKLLQIVLFGQPELDRNLEDPGIRQLKQRISFHYRLGALSHREVDFYLAHRLRVAGSLAETPFTRRSVRALFRASGGIPRLINILANKSLMAVFGEGGRTVSVSHVRAAARDTEGARVPFWW